MRKLRPLFTLSLLTSWACLEADAPLSEEAPYKVNYPANFQVAEGVNLFAFGDYLYWAPQEDGLSYAQGNHLKKIEPSYDSGLRVGLGLNFPKEGYEIALAWLWLDTAAHDRAHGSLIPLWAEPDFILFAPASSAKGDWDLHLNVVDVDWGRASWFGGHFSLKPFFGLRGAWIDQTLRSHFTYEVSPVIQGKSTAHSDFKGGGLRAGADGRFALPHGFSIYGLTSGSLLYGHFNADATTQEEGEVIGKILDRFCQGTSSLQMALGLGWDTHFAKDKLHVELHAAWEQNIWFGINKMNHFISTIGQGRFFQEKGNLTTQGLTVGGRFDF